MIEIEKNIDNTIKGRVHEILVGYYFLNKFPEIKRPFSNEKSVNEYIRLVKELSDIEIDYLLKKAEETTKKIKIALSNRKYRISDITNVYWTHSEKDVSYITKIIDDGNPSDILLEFKDNRYLGISLKSSCSKKNKTTIGNFSTTTLDNFIKGNTRKILSLSRNKLKLKASRFNINPDLYTQSQLRLIEKNDQNFSKEMSKVSIYICRKLAKEYSEKFNKNRKYKKKNILKTLSNIKGVKVPFLLVKTNVLENRFEVSISNPLHVYNKAIDKSDKIEFINNPNTSTIHINCDNERFGDLSFKAHRGAFFGYKCYFTMSQK